MIILILFGIIIGATFGARALLAGAKKTGSNKLTKPTMAGGIKL